MVDMTLIDTTDRKIELCEHFVGKIINNNDEMRNVGR